MSTVKTVGSNGDCPRREHGYFGPGNKAAAGNGNARRMQEFRRRFLEAVDPETIPKLVEQLSAAALGGDFDATKLLLEYTVGKPSQALELSGPEGEPLGLNVGAITTIILGALAGPEHAEARVALAARFKELADDARDRDRDGDGV
jgi:hypothetical protein